MPTAMVVMTDILQSRLMQSHFQPMFGESTGTTLLEINPTSNRPSKNSTTAILLDPTVEPLRCFHSLYEILLGFYSSEFQSFLYRVGFNLHLVNL